MFATQHYMDTLSDRPGKRGRDDELEAANGGLGSFSEHRNKRLQSLPLRSSPKASQQWLPSSAVTPLNSSPATEYAARHAMATSSFPPDVQQVASQDTDMDMNSGPPQNHDHRHLGTGSAAIDATNRMPTPIQPSFAAQVRGQSCEWAENTSAAMHGVSPNGQAVPRSLNSTSDWQSVQSNRRLPSPISEYDDAMSGQFSDGQNMPDHCAHSIDPTQSPTHAMEHPNAMLDIERPRTADADGGESPGPSPSRRGHMRSKHTIDTWTWQPGMKRSFSIGYRADCEKCRLKVPGHFNHIIIS